MAATTTPSISLRSTYKRHREEKGKPRERLVLYSLRLLLRDERGFTIRRIPGRRQAEDPRHIPDLAVFYRGRELAEVEVTGTDLAWREMILKGWIFVLPHKVEYGARLGKRYIYAFFNDAEFPTGEWLLWLNGQELAIQAHLAREADAIWEGKTRQGVFERYYMVPKAAFKGGQGGAGLVSLAHYIRWLAGLVRDPSPTALANFMADGGVAEAVVRPRLLTPLEALRLRMALARLHRDEPNRFVALLARAWQLVEKCTICPDCGREFKCHGNLKLHFISEHEKPDLIYKLHDFYMAWLLGIIKPR